VITSADNYVLSSTDGTRWTKSVLPSPINSLSVIAYGNSIFLAVSDCENCSIAAVSADGVHWKDTTIPIGGYWESIAFTDGVFVTSGAVFNTTTSASLGAVTSDGVNWQVTQLPTKQYWNAMAAGNGTFVALGDDGSQAVAVGTKASLLGLSDE